MRRLTRIVKVLVVALMMLLTPPGAAMAETTAFGLTIGKTTVSELKETYRVQQRGGVNKWTNGPMYRVSTDQIGFEGLNNFELIFSEDEILLGIFADFSKSEFNYLNGMLAQKYQLMSSKTPSVGNKFVRYRDGQTQINLDAPHMSFKVKLKYMHDSLIAQYKEGYQKEQRQKQEQDASKL